MIAERRDRSSKAKLPEAMERMKRQNAAVYWLTFSPFLEPFTVRPKTAEDVKPEADSRRSTRWSRQSNWWAKRCIASTFSPSSRREATQGDIMRSGSR